MTTVFKYYAQGGSPVKYGGNTQGTLQVSAMMRRISDKDIDFKPTRSILDADIVIWTGGQDVSPNLYGEKALPWTTFNPKRDLNDMMAYHFSSRAKLRLGICRGAQFLNVMSGGSLWQHVQGKDVSNNRPHASGQHRIHRYRFRDKNELDLSKNMVTDAREYNVTSTHHQMMKPSEDGLVIGVATKPDYSSFSLCGRKHAGSKLESSGSGYTLHVPDAAYDDDHEDVEIVWYPKTRSLCIQGHPEYSEASTEFRNDVRSMIEEFIN